MHWYISSRILCRPNLISTSSKYLACSINNSELLSVCLPIAMAANSSAGSAILRWQYLMTKPCATEICSQRAVDEEYSIICLVFQSNRVLSSCPMEQNSYYSESSACGLGLSSAVVTFYQTTGLCNQYNEIYKCSGMPFHSTFPSLFDGLDC